MSAAIQRYILILLLLTGTLLLPATSRSQSVIHVYGNYCVGLQNTFAWTGSGTVTSWSISGNYTTMSTSGNSITVKWNAATVASVTAYYSGPSGSGNSYLGNIAVGTSMTPAVSISASTNNVCKGTNITFTASGTNGGTSPYYIWYVNGSSVANNSGATFTTNTLNNSDQVYCTLVSSYQCVTSTTANSNVLTMTINNPANMTATISGTTTLCNSTNVGYSCSVQNGVGTLSYQWQRNGGNISSNQGTPPPYVLSYGPVNNGDVFRCIVTSNGCAGSATSNAVTVSITTPPAFTVSVGPSGGIYYCTGQSITFNAYTSQTATGYQWQQNGASIPGATGSSYTTTVTSLSQLQGIGCYATTSGGCVANTSATGTAANIPFTVNTTAAAGVSISSSAGSSICSGTSVTFTASPVNGGSGPQYQWMLNGTAVSGANASTWTTSTLTNGQQVSCQLTSNAACATPTTATSNAITMGVTQTQQMGITISGSATICQGALFSLGASGSNTTGTLSWQWMKNGSNITTDGPGAQNVPAYVLQYQETAEGDVFTCRVSSDAACALSATSNAVTAHIATPVSFSAGISPPALSLCQDAPVTFTATGSQPIYSYQWKFQGSIISGATGSTYTTTATSVTDLQAFSVDVTTSSTGCIANGSTNASTAGIPFNISPTVPTAVSFAASPGDIIVKQPVTFTSTALNPGTNPSYQWQLNGVNIPNATGASYTKTFDDCGEYQNISLTMVSNAWCAITPAKSSAQYQLHLADWENLNYIRVHEVRVPGVSDWIGVGQLAIGDKSETTVYYDGFGRPVEHVDREAATPAGGGAWGDIVTPIAYDAFGRMPNNYLPYVTTGEAGRFKTAPFTDQAQYYSNAYNETPAYGQTSYESNPMNRVTNTKGPGSVWAASAGNSTTYDLNDPTADNVQIWTVGDNSGDGPVNQGAYPANTLFRTTNTDDKGNLVIEYTTNTGQLILKKVEVSKTHTTPYDGWICTYYVYNDVGLLRFTLQPEAVKYLSANGWSFGSTDILNQLCFRYEYDERGRKVLSKSPGAGEQYAIYDNRDRIVFAQDANQRAKTPGEWTTMLYDELDRPTVTTLYESSSPMSVLRSQIPAGNTVAALSVSSLGGSVQVFNSPLSAADLNNTSLTVIQKFSFYDDYGYPGVKAFNTNFENLQAYSSSDPMTPTRRVLGLPTGQRVRVVGTASFLQTTIYYDEKGRTLQTQEDNIKQGTDVATQQYRFDGAVLSTDKLHTTLNTGYTNFGVLTKYILDARGRVSTIQNKYGSNNFRSVVSLDYDDLGRIKTKHLDPGYTGSGGTELESLTYSYNINDQLTGINKDYALKTTGRYDKWAHFFGLFLGYDNQDGIFAERQLNGQAAGVVWSTQGDDVQRKYDYSYDGAGRLINAAFKEKATPADNWSSALMDFSVTGASGQITYDLNGNLQNLVHRGLVQGNATFMTVDDLHYTYNNLSNILIHVSDNSSLGSMNGMLGDFKAGNSTGGNDYVYDDNGNLVIDLNKNISNIGGTDGVKGVRYNYLNKPELIHIPGKGTVSVVYSADGVRLQRTFTPEGSSTGTTTSYVREFIYQGDDLQYINFEDGRIRVMQTVTAPPGLDMLSMDGNMDLPGGRRGAYDYFLTDQLGNTRMILTEETHSASNTCTMESGRDGNEAGLFGQVDASGTPAAANEVRARFAVTGIPGQTSGNGWNDAGIGDYVSQVGNLAPGKVGPNMLMKVMAGDQVSAQTMYYYKDPVTNSAGGPSVVTNLLSSLAAAIAGGPATTGATHSAFSSTNATTYMNSSALSAIAEPDLNSTAGNNPKAYLTVLFFDERFNFVGEGSAALRVQTSGSGAAPLVFPPTRAPKNGYAFVYVSNESDEMVYFDNLQVSGVRGNILQESHYYPHGLKIAALSSSVIASASEGKIANNYEYQSDNAERDEDIGWDDFALRSYDPQIGRFIQQDPYDQYASPYVGMGNDPVNNMDGDGGFSVPGAVIGGIAGFIGGGIYGLATDGNPVEDAAIGMAGGALLGGLIPSIDRLFGAGEGLEHGAPAASPIAVYSQTVQAASALTRSFSVTAPPADPRGANWIIDMPLRHATPPGVQRTGGVPGHPSAPSPRTAPALATAPPQLQTPGRPASPPAAQPPRGQPGAQPARQGGNGTQELAQRLINTGRVTFASRHVDNNHPNDMANADDNIHDAAAGNPVHTSEYGHAGGRTVNLDPALLRMLNQLALEFHLGISEIAGGRHGEASSRHYIGVAVDINSIDGQPVSISNPSVQRLMQRARELGATEIIGPPKKNHKTHVHLGMPRR